MRCLLMVVFCVSSVAGEDVPWKRDYPTPDSLRKLGPYLGYIKSTNGAYTARSAPKDKPWSTCDGFGADCHYDMSYCLNFAVFQNELKLTPKQKQKAAHLFNVREQMLFEAMHGARQHDLIQTHNDAKKVIDRQLAAALTAEQWKRCQQLELQMHLRTLGITALKVWDNEQRVVYRNAHLVEPINVTDAQHLQLIERFAEVRLKGWANNVPKERRAAREQIKKLLSNEQLRLLDDMLGEPLPEIVWAELYERIHRLPEHERHQGAARVTRIVLLEHVANAAQFAEIERLDEQRQEKLRSAQDAYRAKTAAPTPPPGLTQEQRNEWRAKNRPPIASGRAAAKAHMDNRTAINKEYDDAVAKVLGDDQQERLTQVELQSICSLAALGSTSRRSKFAPLGLSDEQKQQCRDSAGELLRLARRDQLIIENRLRNEIVEAVLSDEQVAAYRKQTGDWLLPPP